MTVEDTLRIAIDALGGQKDLAGAPAILHALAVGLMGQNELEQKVGFLHDVVEDSDLTIENLRDMGVEEDVLRAVIRISSIRSFEAFSGRSHQVRPTFPVSVPPVMS